MKHFPCYKYFITFTSFFIFLLKFIKLYSAIRLFSYKNGQAKSGGLRKKNRFREEKEKKIIDWDVYKK